MAPWVYLLIIVAGTAVLFGLSILTGVMNDRADKRRDDALVARVEARLREQRAEGQQ